MVPDSPATVSAAGVGGPRARHRHAACRSLARGRDPDRVRRRCPSAAGARTCRSRCARRRPARTNPTPASPASTTPTCGSAARTRCVDARAALLGQPVHRPRDRYRRAMGYARRRHRDERRRAEDGAARALPASRSRSTRIDGDRSQVAIDASWGFGEAVVSGSVTPDNFLVDKVLGEITVTGARSRARRSSTSSAATTQSSRSTSTRRRRDAPCLSDDEIARRRSACPAVGEALRLPAGRRVGDRRRPAGAGQRAAAAEPTGDGLEPQVRRTSQRGDRGHLASIVHTLLTTRVGRNRQEHVQLH